MLRFNLQLFKFDPDKDYSTAINDAINSGASKAEVQRLQNERNEKIAASGGSLDKYADSSNYGNINTQATNYISSGGSGGSGGSKNTGKPTDDYGNIDYSALLNSGLGKSIDSYSDDDYNALVEALNQRAEKLTGMTNDPNYSKYLEAQNQYQQQINDIGAYRTQQKQINEMNKNYQEMLDDFYDRYNDLSTKMNDYNFQQTEEYKTLLPIYEEMYRQLGEDARKNTLADASGLTGGLTNSYALAASQQANNQYNTKFTQDVLPTLMDMAYNRFAKGADFELNTLNSAQGLLSQIANADQNYLNNIMSIYGTQRNNYVNDRNFDEGVREYNQNFDYQKERDAVADEQWLKQFQESVKEYQDSMNLAYYKASKSGGSGSSSDANNNGYSNSEIEEAALAAYNDIVNKGLTLDEWMNRALIKTKEDGSKVITTNGQALTQYGTKVFEVLGNLAKNTEKLNNKKENDEQVIFK